MRQFYSIRFLIILACLLTSAHFCTRAQHSFDACHDDLQAEVSAAPESPKACKNSCTELYVDDVCIADVLVDDFEGGAPNSELWDPNTNGRIGSACGVAEGSGALLMDGDVLRVAETRPLNTSCAKKISFYLTYGTSAVPGECEDADLPEENVSLEFFNPVTGVWTELETYDNGGENMIGPYDSWTKICLALPPAARADGTKFRWIQPNNSGEGYDSWALDAVAVEYMPANLTFTWQPGGLNGERVEVCPAQTTTYTVTASTGAYQTTGTVTVETVDPAVPGTLSSPKALYCHMDTVPLALSGYSHTEEADFQYSHNGADWFSLGCGPKAALPAGAPLSCFHPGVSDTLYFRAAHRNADCPETYSNIVRADFSKTYSIMGGGSYCEGEFVEHLWLEHWPRQPHKIKAPNGDDEYIDGVADRLEVAHWEYRPCDSSLPWTRVNSTDTTFSFNPPPYGETCVRVFYLAGDDCHGLTHERKISYFAPHEYNDITISQSNVVQECSATAGIVLVPSRSSPEIMYWETSSSPNCDTDTASAQWTRLNTGVNRYAIAAPGPFDGLTHRCYRARILHRQYNCDSGYSAPARVEVIPCQVDTTADGDVVTREPVELPDKLVCCGEEFVLAPDSIPDGYEIAWWETSKKDEAAWRFDAYATSFPYKRSLCNETLQYRAWLRKKSAPSFGFYTDSNTVVAGAGVYDQNGSFAPNFSPRFIGAQYCEGGCAMLLASNFSNRLEYPTDSLKLYKRADNDPNKWIEVGKYHIPLEPAPWGGMLAPQSTEVEVCGLEPGLHTYRAVVSNRCDSLDLGFTDIFVDSSAVPGTLSRTHTVCLGDTSATIELTGYSGTIINWERDEGCNGNWQAIPGFAGDAYRQPGVDRDFCFRVLVHKPTAACPPAYSNEIKVSPIDLEPDAGVLSGAQAICLGMTPDSLRLDDFHGPVQRWEYAYDAEQGPWNEIQNDQPRYTDANLKQSACFRALVGVDYCNDTSNYVCVDVEMRAIAGSIMSDRVACRDSCVDLRLTESNGDVEKWQYRVNCEGPWIDDAHDGNYFYGSCAPRWADSVCVRSILRRNLCPRDTTGIFRYDIYKPTIPGRIAPEDSAVCRGTTPGPLRLEGHQGDLLRWERSEDCLNFAAFTEIPLSAGKTEIEPGPLNQTTCFRAVLRSGACGSAVTGLARVRVDAPSAGGTAGPNQNVCPGDALGQISLQGYSGALLRWERSEDCPGFSDAAVVNHQAPVLQPAGPVYRTTCFRAVVQNGVCPEQFSASATITLGVGANTGALSGDEISCGAANPASLELSGHTGTILRWESAPATAPFAPAAPISHASAAYQPDPNASPSCYRVALRDAVCGEVFSNPVCVLKVVPTNPGVAAAQKPSVCPGDVGGLVILSGRIGQVVRWEKSADDFTTSTIEANTGDTLRAGALTERTCFRAVVARQGCDTLASAPACIDVAPGPAVGAITGGTTICAGAAPPQLTLNGAGAPVLRWQSSVSGLFAADVQNLTNNTTTLTADNTASRWYRAVLQGSGGACPEAFLPPARVEVAAPSVGGAVAGIVDTVCAGAAPGRLELNGAVGQARRWEFSDDDWQTVVALPVAADTLVPQTPVESRACYRAVVQNETCPEARSTPFCIEVYPSFLPAKPTGPGEVCIEDGKVSVSLPNVSGNIAGWQSSTDGFDSFEEVASTNNPVLFEALAQPACFRALVSENGCAPAVTDTFCVGMVMPSYSGFVSEDQTVCVGENAGALALIDRRGEILGWEKATGACANFAPTPGTQGAESIDFQNLADDACYRAIVRNGVCPADTAFPARVEMLRPRVASITVDQPMVCAGDSVNLRLDQSKREILFWEASTDNFATRRTISDTSAIVSSGAVTERACFRAVVSNSFCAADTSTPACIEIFPGAQPGTISAERAEICEGESPGMLTISGANAPVLRWERAPDAGFSPGSVVPISHTGTAYAPGALSAPACFRAVFGNGACPEVPGPPVCVEVQEATLGGSLDGAATVCQGEETSGALTLSGQRGRVLRWERSTDDFQTFETLNHTGAALNYDDLQETTCYRAVAQNGVCATAYSTPVCVQIDLPSQAGTLSPGKTVCLGDNNVAAVVNGRRGDIRYWERKIGADNWVVIPNSSNGIYVEQDIMQRQCYRVVLQNGVCPEETSPETCFDVEAPPKGGVLSGGGPVCPEANGGVLRLSLHDGEIARWERAEGQDCETNFFAVEAYANAGVTFDFQNLKQKTCYRVAVRNAVCGEVYSTVAAVIPGKPEIALSPKDVLCHGHRGEGQIEVDVSGGAPYHTGAAYRYEWRKGGNFYENSKDLTGLDPGTYCLDATDAAGCGSTECATISQPPPIGARVDSVKWVTCLNGADGFIEMSVWGGVAPYTYIWENNGLIASTQEDPQNIRSGLYRATITDANGCQFETDAYEVVESPKLYAVVSYIRPPRCFGETNGALGVDVKGGIAPYTYRWSNGRVTEDMLQIGAASYTVTATDAAGCAAEFTFNVPQPEPLKIDVNEIRNISCAGGNDGAIGIDVSGGNPAYRYYWANDARQNFNTEDIAGAPAGRYSLYVTDAKGCRAQTSLILVEPKPLKISIVSDADDNCGNSARAVVEGGTPPYAYLWTNGSTTAEASGLAPGAHTVTVRDANGCRINGSVIMPPKPFELFVNTHQHAACHGGTEGALAVTVFGGNGVYQYEWTGPDGRFVSAKQDISNLGAGTYRLTVTDQKNCAFTETFEIEEPAAPLTASIAATKPASCPGANDGRIALSIHGGTPPYTADWNSGHSDRTIEDLPPGTYIAEVRDANGCLATVSAVLTAPEPIKIAQTEVVSVRCAGETNGALAVDVSGGAAPYIYRWSNGAQTENLSGVPAGNYGLTVTDVNGCEALARFNVDEPEPLKTEIVQAQPAGCADGVAEIRAMGGAQPYVYQWSNGGANPRIAVTEPGDYSVTVTDANGCQTARLVKIDAAPALIVQPLLTRAPTCANHENGLLFAQARGGAQPHQYEVYRNNTLIGNSPFLTSLKAGTYRIVATDAGGCSAVFETTLQTPPQLTAELLRRPPSCPDANDGEISAVVSGGVPPYAYQWSNGHNQPALQNLGQGVYILTVRDANNCSSSFGAVLFAPPKIQLETEEIRHAACGTQAEGLIRVRASSGTAPYSFQWSNGATGAENAGISPGLYNVTATDANGCATELRDLRVNGGDAPEISVSYQRPEKCAGTSGGSLGLDVTGGTQPYTFRWAHGATTEDLRGLSAGTYRLTLTDAEGCELTRDFEIDGPDAPLEITAQKQDVSCADQNDGLISLEVTGGKAPYRYLWTHGGNASGAANLRQGNYTAFVIDALGCIEQQSFRIKAPAPLRLETVDVKPAGCGAGGTAEVRASGGTPPYHYDWGGGQSGAKVSGLSAGTRQVRATDANGCAQLLRVTIPESGGLSLELESKENVSCRGGADGALLVNARGGKPPYQYVWAGAFSGRMATGLSAGSYTVLAFDAGGCQATATYQIEEPQSGLSLTLTGVPPSCGNCSNGMIFTSVSGGVRPYLFSFNGGPALPQGHFFNLEAGNYLVRVTDANGCTTSKTYRLERAARAATGKTLPPASPVVYPNPNNGAFAVQFFARAPQSVSAKLIDLRGAEVWYGKQEAAQGVNLWRPVLPELPAGVYVLLFRVNEETSKIKLVIE